MHKLRRCETVGHLNPFNSDILVADRWDILRKPFLMEFRDCLSLEILFARVFKELLRRILIVPKRNLRTTMSSFLRQL